MEAFYPDGMLYNKGCYGQVGAGLKVWMGLKMSGDCPHNHCLNEKKKVILMVDKSINGLPKYILLLYNIQMPSLDMDTWGQAFTFYYFLIDGYLNF